MNIFTKKETLIHFLKSIKDHNKSIGFVPTMGALHQGHLSLIEKSNTENNITVVSIFVNPIQFNNQDDLTNYPRTLEEDIQLIKSIAPKAIIFTPNKSDIFENETIDNHYEFDGIDQQMEGAFRPNHFDGVATIVNIFFKIVQPNKAYFGEKDFQQLQIIKKLVEKKNINTEVIGCSIVREENGLAMSSRNERLSNTKREEAKLISNTLTKIQNEFSSKNIEDIKKLVKDTFKSNPDFELEYFEISDSQTLRPHSKKETNTSYRAFIAVHVENIRLIDNISLN